MKKTITLRLEEETIEDLSKIADYEKETNCLDLTVSDISRQAILKHIKEYNTKINKLKVV